jgi:hypothetical protein
MPFSPFNQKLFLESLSDFENQGRWALILREPQFIKSRILSHKRLPAAKSAGVLGIIIDTGGESRPTLSQIELRSVARRP